MAYELFCNSVRGASHIRKDIPCEDFGLKFDSGELKIFAVADGHGDKNCPRSSIGSEYACKIAAKELENFASAIKEQAWEDKLFDKEEARELVEKLIMSIVGKWIDAVGEELKGRPVTGEELAVASYYADEYLNGVRTERMYGTTLIAGIQTDKYLLLIQQGDGRCVVFDSKGNATQPIPWDDRCLANATTSLCDEDAMQSCRYHIINLEENPVIAVIAGSDGVEDSFPSSMEKMHGYYRDLLKYACENGVYELQDFLTEDLNDLNANGSADDTTVSGIIDVERVMPFLGVFEEQNRIIDLEDEAAVLSDRVTSIEEGGRLEYLTKKHNDAAAAYEMAKRRYNKLTVACQTLKETLDLQEQGAPEASADIPASVVDFVRKYILPCDSLSLVKNNFKQKCEEWKAAKADFEAAKANKDAAEAEYIPFKERYDIAVQKRDDAIRRLNEYKTK